MKRKIQKILSVAMCLLFCFSTAATAAAERTDGGVNEIIYS